MWASRSKWPNHPHQADRHQQGAPLSHNLPPQGEAGGRVRQTHFRSPSPAPSSTSSLQQHAPPPPYAPQGRKNGEGGEETGQGGKGRTKGGNRTGQTALAENSAERRRRRRKGKRERIIVVEAPVRPADAHPSEHKSVLESANPTWTRSAHLDAPGQRHGQQPVSGTADPRSSQTGQVIQGLR